MHYNVVYCRHMNLHHSLEIISITEVKNLSEKKLETILTPFEKEYCQAQKKRSLEHIAARLAAKKALAKIIPLEDMLDVEIQKDPNGKPLIRLSGPALKEFEKLKANKILISLSHTEEEGIASLILI